MAKKLTPEERRGVQQATAGRVAREKDERVAKDASLDASLTNLSTSNTAQNNLLQSHIADISDLKTRMSNQEAVNTAQQANTTDLVGFRNRAARFATEGHVHDDRYFGKGTMNIWFLRTVLHPDGVQLHGPGYHA